MKISDTSIRRPVLTTMVIAAIMVFGVVLYQRLRVDLYPEVDFPMITVSVVYPGADPETIEEQVVDPIEEVVNGIAGIRSLRSTSIESVGQILIELDLDTDASSAAQDVRDRIATVRGTLPHDVEDPVVQKLDLGSAPVLQLALSGPDADALQEHARTELVPALERLEGVGQVTVLGGRAREVHVWLDPTSLRSYGLTVSDVAGALAAQNVDLPGGRVARGGVELTLRTDASARSDADLSAIVVSDADGVPIRLRDVARVESGYEELRSSAQIAASGRQDAASALVIVVRKQSDANTVVVADAVDEVLAELRAGVPPGGELEVLVDSSRQIRASLDAVQLDLVLGAVLAVGIILVFLRDRRATLISALALPVSVVGTFGFVQVMGFTLNMMTTLALSLSIGILIDDAIVVIENIVRRRTELGEGPVDAARRGTAEIGLAVLATTLSIVAVFVPVAFMEGMIGQFFFEFGLTVAFAVLLSLFVSFTLTPMLSARFLEDGHSRAEAGLSGAIGRGLDWLDERYRGVVRWALRHRFVTLGAALASLVAAIAAFPMLGFELVPIEDTGQFSVKIETPRGTDLETTAARTEAAAALVRELEWVDSTFEIVGGGARQRVDSAEIIVTMTPREERDLHMVDAMAEVRARLAGSEGITAVVEQLTAISAGGARSAPVQIDIRGRDSDALRAVARRVVRQLAATPGFVDVDSSAELPREELRVRLDPERAADQGVTAAQVATTVRSMVAGEVATQIQSGGERIDVRLQLREELRHDLAGLHTVQLRSRGGELVELGAVATLERGHAASQIDRENRQRQVSIYANIEGIALGDALPIAVGLTRAAAGDGITVAVGGSGKMLEESVASMGLALFLAIICVYFILASQFESFVHPLTIMSSVPFAMVGAVGGLLVAGMTMSIFAMIGLILLMGLVTKNAILLVDSALGKIRAGAGVDEALEEAGATRLRPILMTTAAMIFGMLPVAIGHGDGGEIRAPMGVTVIGGLITSTVLTLVVVPTMHVLVESAIRRVRSWFKNTQAIEAPADDPAAEPAAQLS